MPNSQQSGGQKALRENVLKGGLCTNCGACVNLCPYFAYYKDQTVIMDECDREDGRCSAFCPRTLTDLEALRRQLYDANDLTPELGPMKGFYITRAADEGIRRGAQHGGTVTALMTLALQEGVIDAAVLARDKGKLLPESVIISDPSELVTASKSKFVVSPTVAAFHEVAKGDVEKIGVVATPCQALAFAKMRSKPFPEKESHIDKLRLIIGLFCGWALSWRELRALLQQKVEDEDFQGLDIPPSKFHSMEIHTRNGAVEIPLDEVYPCVKEACNHCFDMTAEFSDISVGSARLPEGWEAAKNWNHVIVRSEIGRELLELARDKGCLEFHDVPEENIDKLKTASMNKKRFALKSLADKSGNVDDLLYLDRSDPVLGPLSS